MSELLQHLSDMVAGLSTSIRNIVHTQVFEVCKLVFVFLLLLAIIMTIVKWVRQSSNDFSRFHEIISKSKKLIKFVVLVHVFSIVANVFLQSYYFYSAYLDGYLLVLRKLVILLLVLRFSVMMAEVYYSNIPQGDSIQKIYRSVSFGKLVKCLLYIMAGIVALDILGVNIGALLTFGGISGLVIGFAARDSIANFFGFLIIALDSPFRVGDMIYSDDKNISGIVENVNWRCTKVMSYEKRPMYVPNSLFLNIIVRNDSRMLARRLSEKIRIIYSGDVGSLSKLFDAVKECVHADKNIIHDGSVPMQCNIMEIGEDFFEVFLYIFFKTKSWSEFLDYKQGLLQVIASKLNDLDAHIINSSVQVELNLYKK